MARGSTTTAAASGSSGHSGAEMLGATGSLAPTGKASIVKKYFVTNEGDLNDCPAIQGFLPTNIQHVKVGPGWEQTVTYDALHAGIVLGSTGFDGGSSDRGTFEILTSYEVVPIIKHPRITKLKEQYNGTEVVPGYIIFPEFLEGKGALGGDGTGTTKAKTNPMYGVTSYKEYTFTFRHTYYAQSVSGSILNRAGMIVEKLPGGFPQIRGEQGSDGRQIRRQWLVQMPALRKEGKTWRIEQDYILLDAKGMADDVYIKGA